MSNQKGSAQQNRAARTLINVTLVATL